MTQPELNFDGATFDPVLDGPRLGRLLQAVYLFMCNEDWVTLAYLAEDILCSEATISARIRDLRKAKFGGHTIERRRVPNGNGLHEYRLVRP